MALKAKLDQAGYDALDDAGKANYKKAGDGYVVDIEGIQDVTSLENTVKALRGEIKEARDKAKEFEGIDPVKAREYAQKAEEAQRKLEAESGNFKSILDQTKDAHAKELKARDDRYANLEGFVSNKVRSEAVTAALAKHKGNILLAPHVEKQTKVVAGENGEYTVQVVGPDGKPRVDGKGDLMTVDGLVELMKSDELYGRGFDAEPRGGSGAPPNKQGLPGGLPDKGAPTTSTSKIAAGLSKLAVGQGVTIG